ncbi:serine hydroxymethyltransferase [Goodfellowiella coeruleoviolacea]|uniref:Probable serine hydroxymethyltransferase n=1 Tax=Goodfellowiella coeruleoviolacea TaxID=334858 RepID=A0AAE3KH40_9PSEU|nr:serine hydroxymethyltransferase [Goodfellowiella coeruleoviolacea]MCP2166910.1 glycine hydroxymethyltransferase [Goodfellowiella coeruleoviolacea]
MDLDSLPPVGLSSLAVAGAQRLRHQDPVLHDLLEREQRRQSDTLAMIASASWSDPSVLACEGSASGNITTEGYPGRRYHAGCEVVDEIERLAIDRAKAAFGARYANVQPHSGSTANQLVMTALLNPGDLVMGLELAAGGHLTHGSAVSFSGRYFRSVSYGVDEQGLLDYAQIERLAVEHRPKLIICGASAYPREIDFARFREIADHVGAFLLADISHIAGLVAAGVHPSPVDHAHVTTTSTYKQLYGPRGGLVLVGRDADLRVHGRPLTAVLQNAVFPYFQGTPRINGIAAKARAFDQLNTPEFRLLATRILGTARTLAAELAARGWPIVTGGTDNHMVLADVGARGLTGAIAEQALESCGIIVNRNKIHNDGRPARIAGGIRFGTNILALRGMDDAAIAECAAIVDQVWTSLTPLDDTDFLLPDQVRQSARAAVATLCWRFPLPA